MVTPMATNREDIGVRHTSSEEFDSSDELVQPPHHEGEGEETTPVARDADTGSHREGEESRELLDFSSPNAWCMQGHWAKMSHATKIVSGHKKNVTRTKK